MPKDTVNRAAAKVAEGVKLAGEAAELYSKDFPAAQKFAEMAMNEFNKANDIAGYLPYVEKRLIGRMTGPAALHLRDTFDL